MFSPDGKRIATSRLWDAETGALQTALEGHTGYVMCCAFSPDGMRVMTGSHDTTARLWVTETGALQETLEGHNDAVMS
jgi:WD40 repeat protein